LRSEIFVAAELGRLDRSFAVFDEDIARTREDRRARVRLERPPSRSIDELGWRPVFAETTPYLSR